MGGIGRLVGAFSYVLTARFYLTHRSENDSGESAPIVVADMRGPRRRGG